MSESSNSFVLIGKFADEFPLVSFPVVALVRSLEPPSGGMLPQPGSAVLQHIGT